MFNRNLQIFRLLSNHVRARLFSTTNICLNINQEQNQLINKEKDTNLAPIKNQLPAVGILPSYLPEPTGVKSKLYDDFYLIYRFRFYRQLRYVQVLKLLQTLATAIIIPYKIYIYQEGLIELFELQLSFFFLSLATSSLFIFGWAATRTICYMYTTEDCNQVILTLIDFWGRRYDINFETSDIVPINDIETPNKSILPFKRYSNSDTFYYTTKISQILDRPRFNRLFSGIITQDKKDWW